MAASIELDELDRERGGAEAARSGAPRQVHEPLAV